MPIVSGVTVDDADGTCFGSGWLASCGSVRLFHVNMNKWWRTQITYLVSSEFLRRFSWFECVYHLSSPAIVQSAAWVSVCVRVSVAVSAVCLQTSEFWWWRKCTASALSWASSLQIVIRAGTRCIKHFFSAHVCLYVQQKHLCYFSVAFRCSVLQSGLTADFSFFFFCRW